MRRSPEQELSNLGGSGLRFGLPSRIQSPGVIAVNEVSETLFADDGLLAAATREIISLRADIFFFSGSAAVIDRVRVAAQFEPGPIGIGSVALTDGGQPTLAGILN